MRMDALVTIETIFVTGLAAHLDYTTRRIPDALAICLWLLAIMFSPTEALLLASVFTFLLLINDIHYQVLKKPMLGWGDVFFIPPFFAIVDSTFGSVGSAAAVLFVALGVISSSVKKEGERGEPIVAWLFVCILALTAFQIVRTILQI